MYRCMSIFISIITMIGTWFVYRWTGNALHYDGALWASVIIGSTLAHEIGHMIMLEKKGIRTHLFFLVLLAGVFFAKSERRKFSKLNFSEQAAIKLSGVIGNLFFVAGCAVLFLFHQLTKSELELVMSINGAFILYNLIPFWILDGKMFVDAVLHSLDKERGQDFARHTSVTVFAVAALLVLFTNHWFVAAPILFSICLVQQAKKIKPWGNYRRIMTSRQLRFWSALYIVLIASGMLLLLAEK